MSVIGVTHFCRVCGYYHGGEACGGTPLFEEPKLPMQIAELQRQLAAAEERENVLRERLKNQHDRKLRVLALREKIIQLQDDNTALIAERDRLVEAVQDFVNQSEKLQECAKQIIAVQNEVLAMPQEQQDWFNGKPGHIAAFELAWFINIYMPRLTAAMKREEK